MPVEVEIIPNGYFKALPETVGISRQDALAATNPADIAISQFVCNRLVEAARALCHREPAGRC